jgi:hypothetical protein
MSSQVMTFSGRYSPVMTLAEVVAGDHKNRRLVAREHLSTALMSTPLARRVHWAAASVYKVPVFG